MANKRSIISAGSLIVLFSALLPLSPAAFGEESGGATATETGTENKLKPAMAESTEKKKDKKGKKKASGKDTPEQEAVNRANGEEPIIWPVKGKDNPKVKEPAAAAKEEKPEEKKEETSKAPPPDPSRPFSPQAIKDYNQGVELQQQGFLNQAIQKYKSALEADDRIERAYCNLGLIYIAQRNFSKASDAFKKALAMKPNNPFSLNGMGSVFFSKGKLQEAMERWQKAVEVDPNFFSAYFNMANAWKNEHDLDKALDNYVMTIKTNPNMADAYYEIGLIFAKQKHPAQAQSMLARAVQLAPEGDFVGDAKKQLTGLESMMGKDEADGEVKMSIVAPPSKDATSEQDSSSK